MGRPFFASWQFASGALSTIGLLTILIVLAGAQASRVSGGADRTPQQVRCGLQDD